MMTMTTMTRVTGWFGLSVVLLSVVCGVCCLLCLLSVVCCLLSVVLVSVVLLSVVCVQSAAAVTIAYLHILGTALCSRPAFSMRGPATAQPLASEDFEHSAEAAWWWESRKNTNRVGARLFSQMCLRCRPACCIGFVLPLARRCSLSRRDAPGSSIHRSPESSSCVHY